MTVKPIDLLNVKQGKWTLKSETEFTTTAAPNTKFILPKSRKPVEIAVQSFTTVAELEKKYGKRPIPADKFAYIRCNQNSFILLHVRNVNRLYFMSTPYGIPVAVTHKEVFITEEGAAIFFPQKKGALPFTPDCRGYIRLGAVGNIKLPHTVCRYRTTTVDFVKASDIRACRRRYLELKSKYKEEPIIHGCLGGVKHSVDENEWKAYQHRRGYIRMDCQTFLESDFSTKRLGCSMPQLMAAGLKRISIGPAATSYYFIPKHWFKPVEFYTDPSVLKHISKIRKLVATLLDMSPEQQARVKVAIKK